MESQFFRETNFTKLFVKMISRKIRKFHIEYPQYVKNYFKIVQLRKFLIQNLKINKNIKKISKNLFYIDF